MPLLENKLVNYGQMGKYTSKDIIFAMKNHLPVIYKEMTFLCITAYICRYDGGGNQRFTVELLDKPPNGCYGGGVMIAPVNKIQILISSDDYLSNGLQRGQL